MVFCLVSLLIFWYFFYFALSLFTHSLSVGLLFTRIIEFPDLYVKLYKDEKMPLVGTHKILLDFQILP